MTESILTSLRKGIPLRSFAARTVGFFLTALLTLSPFHGPQEAFADDDFSCDSLNAVTPQQGTVWS